MGLGVGSRFNTGGSPSNSFSSQFPSSNSGGSGGGNIQCQTTCQSNGSCKVKIINGPPGPLSGSCFPPDFGVALVYLLNVKEVAILHNNVELHVKRAQEMLNLDLLPYIIPLLLEINYLYM